AERERPIERLARARAPHPEQLSRDRAIAGAHRGRTHEELTIASEPALQMACALEQPDRAAKLWRAATAGPRDLLDGSLEQRARGLPGVLHQVAGWPARLDHPALHHHVCEVEEEQSVAAQAVAAG